MPLVISRDFTGSFAITVPEALAITNVPSVAVVSSAVTEVEKYKTITQKIVDYKKRLY